MNQPITLHIDGLVARLVMNRTEKRNAFTQDMWQLLTTLCAQIAENSAVKVVLLQSASSSVFCAGADIGEFEQLRKDPAKIEQNTHIIEEAMQALQTLPSPTIAVIEGPCFGGGLGLTLCCDFRIAGASARFAITPARLGLTYSIRNIARLSTIVGLQKARRILMLAEEMNATTALEWGLIDYHTASDIQPTLEQLILKTLNLSHSSLRALKSSLHSVAEGQSNDSVEDIQLFLTAFQSDDLKEGMSAFLEKRAPNF